MSSLAVFEAAIWVKINVHDKIMIENKKRKIWKSKKFYIKLHLKHRLQMELTGC